MPARRASGPRRPVVFSMFAVPFVAFFHNALLPAQTARIRKHHSQDEPQLTMSTLPAKRRRWTAGWTARPVDASVP